MSNTNLGQFLYSERIRRGCDSITDYLKNYTNIPISEPYYRDIENGRKKIKVDKADKLCSALMLNKKEFYYHLLSDVLPSDVLKELIKPVAATTFRIASEEFSKLERQVSTMRKAFAKKMMEEPYVVDNDIIQYLNNNFDVLPLIHFVYMKEKCTFREIDQIIKKNNIKRKLSMVASEFEKYDIASVDKKNKTISRFSKIFRVPRNESGIKFKDRFLEDEIKIAINAPNKEQSIKPRNTNIYSSILCIKNGESLNRIENKLTDLLAELEVESSSLDEKETVPYFVSIIFSSRENYQ